MSVFYNLLSASLSVPENIPQQELSTTTMNDILRLVFLLAGALSLLIMMYGGFKYIISRGDAAAIKSAKETIIYAAVGLLICIFGYSMVIFVLARLQ